MALTKTKLAGVAAAAAAVMAIICELIKSA